MSEELEVHINDWYENPQAIVDAINRLIEEMRIVLPEKDIMD